LKLAKNSFRVDVIARHISEFQVFSVTLCFVVTKVPVSAKMQAQ